MTALLSGVVVVLVVCHTPKTVINIYECYQVNNVRKIFLILPGLTGRYDHYSLSTLLTLRKTGYIIGSLEVFVGFAPDE